MPLFSKLVVCLFPLVLFSGCGNSSEPKAIAEQFWSFSQEKELEQAKYYVSWETASYLKYIADDKFKIAHVDLGEITEKAERIEIDTVIVLARKQGDNIRIPTKTIVIKTEDVWRIQLQETLTGIIKQTVNEAAGQVNRMLSDGLNELDKVLSESVNSMSRSLEQGAKELSNRLDVLKKDLDASHK